MATNLDKFEDIEKMMNKAKSEMETFLSALSERQDYMASYRKEFRKINEVMSTCKSSIEKAKSNNEEIEQHLKSVNSKIDRQISSVKAEKEYYTDGSQDNVIKYLENAKEILNKKRLKADDLEEAQIYLNKSRTNIKGIEDLGSQRASNDKLDKLLTLIKATESDYLSGFKAYKSACENSEEVFEAFDDIVGVLLEYRFVDEANELISALPNIEDTRRQRPDPEPLLTILVPIRSNDLEYWQSNFNNSFAHKHNIDFADEVAYTRRALLEKREFKGTESAFKRLWEAYDKLKDYMDKRYHQRGGTPHNYHGHENR